MKIVIDNVELKREQVAFVDWGFGRRLKIGALSTPYNLIVDRTDFIQRFSPVFEICIKELMDDEKMTGKFASPYDEATKYPTLEEFLKLEEHNRIEMINTFFAPDIMALYLRTDCDENVKWVAESIDSFVVDGEILCIGGKAVDINWKY